MKRLRGMDGEIWRLFNKQRKDRELDDETKPCPNDPIEDNLRLGHDARGSAARGVSNWEELIMKEAYRDQCVCPYGKRLWQDLSYVRG